MGKDGLITDQGQRRSECSEIEQSWPWTRSIAALGPRRQATDFDLSKQPFKRHVFAKRHQMMLVIGLGHLPRLVQHHETVEIVAIFPPLDPKHHRRAARGRANGVKNDLGVLGQIGQRGFRPDHQIRNIPGGGVSNLPINKDRDTGRIPFLVLRRVGLDKADRVRREFWFPQADRGRNRQGTNTRDQQTQTGNDGGQGKRRQRRHAEHQPVGTKPGQPLPGEPVYKGLRRRRPWEPGKDIGPQHLGPGPCQDQHISPPTGPVAKPHGRRPK
mmetsp:Transcript_28502/g.53481  ORF Transcript_28502/g.53481 Transcript_28502/m.53481 type:complete len:271 (+) Transcript_28502:3204-4016(+)